MVWSINPWGIPGDAEGAASGRADYRVYGRAYTAGISVDVTGTYSRPPALTPLLGLRHDGSMAALRSPLERFWPSRRESAFDEFCR